jgi:hypothetical protein
MKTKTSKPFYQITLQLPAQINIRLRIMKEKIYYFNEAGFLEIAIFRSNPSKVGSANSLLGLNYRDVVSIQFKIRLALIEKSKIINHMFVRIVEFFTKKTFLYSRK